jgi:hypothetical protein
VRKKKHGEGHTLSLLEPYSFTSSTLTTSTLLGNSSAKYDHIYRGIAPCVPSSMREEATEGLVGQDDLRRPHMHDDSMAHHVWASNSESKSSWTAR